MFTRLVAILSTALVLVSANPAAVAAPVVPALTVSVTGTAGASVPDAQVELVAPGVGIVAMARSDRLGRATLTPDRAAATFWVRVWGAGHGTVDRPWVPAVDGGSMAVALPPLTGAVSGFVVDHLGLPVAGVEVSAWRAGFGLATEAGTGPDGYFTLRGLAAPGPYQIQVVASGYRAHVTAPAAVTAGEERRLDVALAPSAATVSGDVADARTGAALAGARVEVLRKGWGVLATTATDAGGGFSLTVPPAEAPDYQVRVWAQGHALVTTAAFALAPGARKEYAGADRLALAPQLGSLWGYLTDDTGAVMAQKPIDLQLQGVGTVASAQTDDTGFFAFDSTEAGTYRLRAYPGPGWAASDSAWVPVAAGAVRYAGIVAVKQFGRVYEQGIVAGLVTDTAGAPVVGARVSVFMVGGQTLYSAATDAQGRYRIANVDANKPITPQVPGTGYAIKAEMAGHWPSDQPTSGAAMIDVVKQRVTQADFVLRPSQGHVAGTVADDQGTPLAGARVTLLREGTGKVADARTDSRGSYRFPNLTVPLRGGYVVLAEHPGYVPAATETAQDAAAAAGSTVRAALRLKPAVARLQGRATDAQGAGVAAAQVTVLNAATGRTWQATSGAGGWYAVAGLPAGPGDVLLVRGEVDGLRAGTAADGPVALAGSRGKTANLPLAPGGAVAGTVYTTAGAPAASALVALWHEGEAQPVLRRQAAADGSYRFENLVPGDRYTVVAWTDGRIHSGLAPGEALLTPLLRAAAGQTIWADVALSGE